MKLEKKHWIIIGVVVAILVWYFFLRKKKSESGFMRNTMPCPVGCSCANGHINCKESNWKPEYRDVKKDIAALKGISLANISTFGTPLKLK